MLSLLIYVVLSFQFQDVRCYLKGLGADISEENSPEGPLVDMEQVISVCDLIIREATEGI